MRVSRAFNEDTADNIIWEFENLLCNHNIKINNSNPKENEFETATSYINRKDYKKLKEKIIKQLDDLVDYIEIEEVA